MRLSLCLSLVLTSPALADGNRFAYLDDLDPYYPHRTFPKLVTPQWVGEAGVDAVVVLAIDDMRGHEKWEAYLRPILDRLKQLHGTAAVSIMTCQIDPAQPHLQTWLKEGVSLECHTFDHPCPILRNGDFKSAKATYDKCVDLMASVPNNKPVAFRTPCCDSLNTVSPRLFAEIMDKSTAKGNFLQVDSSVFNVFTPNDPDLKREWVTEGDGRARFLKYLPADRDFVNVIEDYPYPYRVGGMWEFPCATPSDWQAQHRHGKNNELTVRDWYACLDCTVKKQGVMNLVFHPHGWIEAKQIVQLIDYAQATYGKRVKFLTFKEALARMDKNLLGRHPLRDPKSGSDNGVRLLDVNGDGYMDAIVNWDQGRECRLWHPDEGGWRGVSFPLDVNLVGERFGTPGGGRTLAMADRQAGPMGWEFRLGFSAVKARSDGLPQNLGGFRLLDLDADDESELIAEDGKSVFRWDAKETRWRKVPFSLPPGASLPDKASQDTGTRFADLDGDGKLDVIFSNDDGYGVYLFESMEKGWSKKAMAGARSDPNAIPPIAIKGTNNGAFIRNRHVYWQNEHTAALPDLIDKRSFNTLIAAVEPGPKTPEQALKLFTVRPGYRVELAACEPQVQDPISMAWGPDDKLWVVEMGDYPNGTDGKGKPGGRVKFLEDADGDGRYEKATVFLDGVPFPTGVLPWRKGVLVTAAPDLFYAEDTDGDGKADVRKVLFTGFREGNQQHRFNGLVWGLDNWVYCANGDSGGTVKSIQTGKSLNLSGRDFRIKPDTGEIELTSGQSQYSKARDDWGNWFGGNNATAAWHVVLEDRHLARNPHQAGAEAVRVLAGSVPVFPTSRTVPRFNDPHMFNRITSACGIGFYRDDLFEPALRRGLFVCEPVHNLVHRLDLVPDGVSFAARRAEDETRSEFLSSADNWFRPVMAKTGPDGALWIADMYRAVIEHPEWIPKDVQARIDLRAGHDRGRIWRVVRVGSEPRKAPRLDKLDTAGLVAALESPNGWQRDMTQMMLLWRAGRDDGVGPPREAAPLAAMVRESKNSLARLQALATLHGLGALDSSVLRIALSDSDPRVAAFAMRLTEGRLAGDAELARIVVQQSDQPIARLALAIVIGSWKDAEAGNALGALLRDHGKDGAVRAAALSSLNADNFPHVADVVLPAPRTAPPVLDGLLAFAVAGSDTATLAKLLYRVADSQDGKFAASQLETLAALLDALGRRKTTLSALAKKGGPELAAAVAKLDAAFAQARQTATDPKAPYAERLTAIRLLGRGPGDTASGRALLIELLGPQTPTEVQTAAVGALARSDAADTPTVLLKSWKGFSPPVRAAVLSALLSRESWLPTVLDALEKKLILPAEVDAVARQRLLTHGTSAIRERAGKLLAGGIDPDRAKVLEAYRPALTGKGDREKGKQVFVKACAACHKVGDVGTGLGPDLTTLADKSAEYLLMNVLDPNRAVEARYVAYTAQTTDGRSRVGFLSAETATSITLVAADGQQHTILRADLEALTGSGKSVMPEGLEKDVSVEQMTDLVTFLKSALPPAKRKQFAGNTPVVVNPGPDGSLKLIAASAEIYGPTLAFEERYQNLGFWGSADDRAVWTVNVPKARRYEVWLDWACPRNQSGKAVAIESNSESVTARIEATANWETYRQAKVGELTLPAGEQRLSARALPPMSGYLMDLRAIRLVPMP
jgi:putative membrane-bound dehydrogenase-like protein